MAGDPKRVEIGFDGGQVVSVRLDTEALGELRRAVEGGGGWHDLESEEGRFSLDLAKVVFMRGAGGSHTVGFSGA
jgi:hypothetical protein